MALPGPAKKKYTGSKTVIYERENQLHITYLQIWTKGGDQLIAELKDFLKCTLQWQQGKVLLLEFYI